MPFTTAYLGLVLPPFWARISIAVVMVTLLGIQLVKPAPDPLEWASVFALVGAGAAIGLLVRDAHHAAWIQSLLLSRSDQLTGVLNRRGFLEQLADELHAAGTADRPLGLLLIDLNGFKRVNDTEGHPAGDAPLAWVASTIADQLPGDAALGRLGGDEFAVALPGPATWRRRAPATPSSGSCASGPRGPDVRSRRVQARQRHARARRGRRGAARRRAEGAGPGPVA